MSNVLQGNFPTYLINVQIVKSGNLVAGSHVQTPLNQPIVIVAIKSSEPGLWAVFRGDHVMHIEIIPIHMGSSDLEAARVKEAFPLIFCLHRLTSWPKHVEFTVQICIIPDRFSSIPRPFTNAIEISDSVIVVSQLCRKASQVDSKAIEKRILAGNLPRTQIPEDPRPSGHPRPFAWNPAEADVVRQVSQESLGARTPFHIALAHDRVPSRSGPLPRCLLSNRGCSQPTTSKTSSPVSVEGEPPRRTRPCSNCAHIISVLSISPARLSVILRAPVGPMNKRST